MRKKHGQKERQRDRKREWEGGKGKAGRKEEE
jgi:hypothetical protein